MNLSNYFVKRIIRIEFEESRISTTCMFSKLDVSQNVWDRWRFHIHEW